MRLIDAQLLSGVKAGRPLCAGDPSCIKKSGKLKLHNLAKRLFGADSVDSPWEVEICLVDVRLL